jgi:hypothetical protein
LPAAGPIGLPGQLVRGAFEGHDAGEEAGMRAKKRPLSVFLLFLVIGLSIGQPALTQSADPPPTSRTLAIGQGGCGPFSWSAAGDAAWLQVQPVGDTIQVGVDTTGLLPGTYSAEVTVEAEAGVLGSPAHIPVTLRLVDELERAYLPLVIDHYSPYP